MPHQQLDIVQSKRTSRAIIGFFGGPIAAVADQPRAEQIAFLLCLAAGLIPIWSVQWFPSVDGPMHLYIVHVVEQLARPGSNVFDRVFQFNYNIEPNFSAYGILWALSQAFPILIAEKMFVSLYWLLFVGGAYYLMRSLGHRSGLVGLLLLPFGLGYFLHWGFYNFVLSQALFLVAAGYTVRHSDKLKARHVAALGLLMLALALTHLVGIVMFLFFVALFRVGIALREGIQLQTGERRVPVVRRLVRDASLLLLAALPALAILGSFLLRRVISDDSAAAGLSLLQKVSYVASISPIFALDKREAIAWGPFTILFWVLVLRLLAGLWRNRELRSQALPALLPPAFLAGFVTIGSLGFAGFEALPRLLPFLFIMLIIALGFMQATIAWRGAIMLAVVGGLFATSWIHFSFYRNINELYMEFAKSRRPPPAGSAVLAFNTTEKQLMVDGRSTGWRVNITDHFRSRYAREHDLLLLNLVHLSPQIYGYFPVSFRPGVDVAAAYSAATFRPPPKPLQHFEQTIGVPIREVSFWPLLESEPHVDFNLEEREPLLRSELAENWTLRPRNVDLVPYVFEKRLHHPRMKGKEGPGEMSGRHVFR